MILHTILALGQPKAAPANGVSQNWRIYMYLEIDLYIYRGVYIRGDFSFFLFLDYCLPLLPATKQGL